MKHVRSAFSIFQMALWLVAVVTIVSWQPDKRTSTGNKTGTANYQDTTPPKHADIDEINLQLNLDSVMQQVNLAMKRIDYSKMNADVEKAMAQIDYKKINKDINAAMKSIDWNEMKSTISQSLDSAKMAIDKIDWNKMKAEINQAQIEAKKRMASQKINMDSLQRQVQKSLQEAQKSLQSARIEFDNYKALQTALEKDGRIQAGKPYSIELKNGILYLNNVKQSKTITEKYSKYYSGKKNFTLKDDGGTDL